MGFWHTGYIEFHESTGLDDFRFDPTPTRHMCTQCDEVFVTPDDLRKHRFENHPLLSPVFLLRGREIGAHRVRVTSPLEPDDIGVGRCDRAVVNGEDVLVNELPRTIAGTTSDVCQIALYGGDAHSEHTLEFRLASEEDLTGVEREFERIALRRKLDVRAIDEFIASTKKFKSAIGFCDGICDYLYGALAKERAPDVVPGYEAYVGRYNRAAKALFDYDRPLARTIGSLIEFHFNHFKEAAVLAGKSRVGEAALRFRMWLHDRRLVVSSELRNKLDNRALDGLISDWQTEQILRWANRSLAELRSESSELERFLRRDIAEFDRAKVQVLLAEAYIDSGDVARARKCAGAVRNIPAFESWAETIIRL